MASSEDYTFLGLSNNGKRLGKVESFAYVLGITDDDHCEVRNFENAEPVLSSLFDVEEQYAGADLIDWQMHSLPHGYSPRTPVLVAKDWSPFSFLMDLGLAPVHADRVPSFSAVATALWQSSELTLPDQLPHVNQQEKFFCEVFSLVFQEASKTGKFVSLVGSPGWSYSLAINSLPRRSKRQIKLMNRVIWKRTPECR